MIEVPILSQRDLRWRNIRLGFGLGSIGDFGCTLTALTALAGKDNVAESNEIFKQKNAFALGNLVIWAKVPQCFPNLAFAGRFYTYDNNKVAEYVYNKKTPVCVEVDATPIGAPRTSHWILYLGDRMILDSWTGRIRPTSDFPITKGFALYDLSTPPPASLTPEEKVNKVREVLNRPDIGDTQKVIDAKKIID